MSVYMSKCLSVCLCICLSKSKGNYYLGNRDIIWQLQLIIWKLYNALEFTSFYGHELMSERERERDGESVCVRERQRWYGKANRIILIRDLYHYSPKRKRISSQFFFHVVVCVSIFVCVCVYLFVCVKISSPSPLPISSLRILYSHNFYFGRVYSTIYVFESFRLVRLLVE